MRGVADDRYKYRRQILQTAKKAAIMVTIDTELLRMQRLTNNSSSRNKK